MAYVFEGVDFLDGQPKVGTKQCVALIQTYTNAPRTALWRQGAPVFGTEGIERGTAIATFVKKVYPNQATGNHAAFYLEQDEGGIWVMDQWANDTTKPTISKRYIRLGGSSRSNQAEAYSVIE